MHTGRSYSTQISVATYSRSYRPNDIRELNHFFLSKSLRVISSTVMARIEWRLAGLFSSMIMMCHSGGLSSKLPMITETPVMTRSPDFFPIREPA